MLLQPTSNIAITLNLASKVFAQQQQRALKPKPERPSIETPSIVVTNNMIPNTAMEKQVPKSIEQKAVPVYKVLEMHSKHAPRIKQNNSNVIKSQWIQDLINI